MDSLNSQKAVKSHPSKVSVALSSPNAITYLTFFCCRQFQVVNDQSNKTTVAKVGQSNQSDLRDTNFEYEDNEWDDVGEYR